MIRLALALVLLSTAAHAQRTTCYDSGNTRICDSVDAMGNPTAKTRCYKSGNDTRCDTQSINNGAAPSVLPVPFTPRRP